jgi:UDP-N-acetylglucosamine 4-epimerase
MQINPVSYELPEGVEEELRRSPKTWLVTGVAGFIGSHLLEALLKLDQMVVGLDNFATGHPKNLEHVKDSVSVEQWNRFRLIEGDICDEQVCKDSVVGVDYVLHQAALGSVPRSLENPARSNRVNVDGFVNMLTAAKDHSVASFVYAASSSTYGDHPGLPKVEDRIGTPLSPYGLTKWVNELYSQIFESCYGFRSIGLRYFNVYGPRQDPNGAYAAVIPKWIDAMLQGRAITINGDGQTSRDFCFVANAVQANILAALRGARSPHRIYNVAVGGRTSLNELYDYLAERLSTQGFPVDRDRLSYGPFRRGDVAHSQADISRIEDQLGYRATYDIRRGLDSTVAWFVQTHKRRV